MRLTFQYDGTERTTLSYSVKGSISVTQKSSRYLQYLAHRPRLERQSSREFSGTGPISGCAFINSWSSRLEATQLVILSIDAFAIRQASYLRASDFKRSPRRRLNVCEHLGSRDRFPRSRNRCMYRNGRVS